MSVKIIEIIEPKKTIVIPSSIKTKTVYVCDECNVEFEALLNLTDHEETHFLKKVRDTEVKINGERFFWIPNEASALILIQYGPGYTEKEKDDADSNIDFIDWGPSAWSFTDGPNWYKVKISEYERELSSINKEIKDGKEYISYYTKRVESFEKFLEKQNG